jgi:poly(3-hydroxybutyrate) depolymerase
MIVSSKSSFVLSARIGGVGIGLSAAMMACAPIQAQPVRPAPASEVSAPFTPAQLKARGVQRFVFADWAGPALPIWYYRPEGAAADAPLLFVFHGVRRDADRYIGEWLDVAAREKVIIVVPEFASDAFPGARGYNHGNLLDEKGAANPAPVRSFSLIEPLFDAMRAREQLTRAQYWLFGHSAGAQYVHRFVMTGHARRMERAVSANAGSYMYPDARYRWPFGTGGLPGGIWNPEAAYAARMTILLGTADDDPNYPSLPRDPEAMAQGPHRLARGIAFFAAARTDAMKRGHTFSWNCALAPGIGHDNGGMAPFGIAALREETSVIPCP